MSIEVIYQGLTIAKGPSFRLQDGGVFIETDGPMPVATTLSLTHGERALRGQVRRVTEGAGSGMLIVPSEGKQLPRWLLPLGPTSVANVELEPEPAPPEVKAAPPESPPAPAPAELEAAPPAVASPSAPAEAKSEPAGSDFLPGEPAPDAAEPVAASGHTPSEHDAGAKEEEEEHAAKPTDKKAPAAASAKKKKGRKR